MTFCNLTKFNFVHWSPSFCHEASGFEKWLIVYCVSVCCCAAWSFSNPRDRVIIPLCLMVSNAQNQGIKYAQCLRNSGCSSAAAQAGEAITSRKNQGCFHVHFGITMLLCSSFQSLSPLCSDYFEIKTVLILTSI